MLFKEDRLRLQTQVGLTSPFNVLKLQAVVALCAAYLENVAGYIIHKVLWPFI